MTDVTAWLSSDALDLMVNDADVWAPAETGGVLCGYWVTDQEVVISTAIGAGPNASHDTTGFEPDAEFQLHAIADVYERSGRHRTYLGDWHTHPAGGAALSGTDRATARRIARSRTARCPRPIMLLLSGPDEWGLSGWVVTRGLWRTDTKTLTFRGFTGA